MMSQELLMDMYSTYMSAKNQIPRWNCRSSNLRRTQRMTTRPNWFKQQLLLVKLLLTTYVDSEKYDCPFSFEYLDSILSIIDDTISRAENEQNDKNLYWLKIVAAGIDYYNNSDGFELTHSEMIINYFIRILEHIIDNNTDRILSDMV